MNCSRHFNAHVFEVGMEVRYVVVVEFKNEVSTHVNSRVKYQLIQYEFKNEVSTHVNARMKYQLM